MSECVYEMKMPARYVELSADEMEYDGGIIPLIVLGVGIGLSVVGTGCSIYGMATDNQLAKDIGTVCAIAGLIMTGGGVLGAALYGVKLTTAAMASAAFTAKGATSLGAFNVLSLIFMR